MAGLYPKGSTYIVGGQEFYQGKPISSGWAPLPPKTPAAPAAPAAPSAPGPSDTMTLDGASSAQPGAPGGVGWINLRHEAPDYSGLVGAYTGDWQARLNAGIASNQAQRLSRARSTVNRLGIRDASAAYGKLAQFGLTEEDLRMAQDNPWSDLKAIQQQADRSRGQSQAEFAARGGFRSGGTAQAMEDIENQRARNEATSTEEAYGALSGDLFNASEWERQQRDEMDQRAADLQMQMAQTYPAYNVQALWDPSAQAYRHENTLYDQYGNVIR